jgi:hypothetical protein
MPAEHRCSICGAPARFGYGLPPRPTVWVCLYHRAKLDAEWVPSLYAPLPRTKGNVRGRPGDKVKQGQLF